MIVAVIRWTQAIGITSRLLAPGADRGSRGRPQAQRRPGEHQQRVMPGSQVRRGVLGDVAPLGDENHA